MEENLEPELMEASCERTTDVGDRGRSLFGEFEASKKLIYQRGPGAGEGVLVKS